MSHEVVKRVGTRAYRYRVESYRDPATKKARSHWTYLGRVATDGEAQGTPGVRRRESSTRERLIDSFERLLETVAYERLTAGAVAAEANLAHGTFYRYFKDKRAVLLAALDRLRAEFDRVLPHFEPPYGDAATERARLRRWVEAVLGKPASHAGLLRAYLDVLEGDAEFRELRLERQRVRVRAIIEYLIALDAAGTIAVTRAESLASALLALVDATLRSAIVAGVAPEPAMIGGVCDVFERAIFGPSAAF